MADYRYIGQEKGTLDCGFFAAYTLKLMQDTGGDVNNLQMAQAEVYAARDAFCFPPAPSPGQPGDQWLDFNDAPLFLHDLGVTGYWVEFMHRACTAEDLLARLVPHLKRPNSHGVMVAQIGSAQHWISLLGEGRATAENGYVPEIIVYDPAYREGERVQAKAREALAEDLANNKVGALVVSAL
jgi:hypothetical protein